MKQSNEIFLTNVHSIKMKSTNITIDEPNIIQKGKNSTLTKEKLTENFFGYLVNEKSNYANFEKVAEYYEMKLFKNENIYNINKEKIKNKKEEIMKLQQKLFNVILSHINVEDNLNLELYYKKRIKQLRQEINFVEQEFEVYKNIYSELYKKHYNLNAKLETMKEQVDTLEQQYKKYINIKTTADNKILKQKNLLKSLNFYYHRIHNLNENIITKKQKKLNYEIQRLKSDDEQKEVYLRKIIEQNKEIDNFIQQSKKQYLLYMKDLKVYIKDYFKDCLNMDSINKIIKENDIELIRDEYNKIIVKNKLLSSMCSHISKKIIKLNNIFVSLVKEHNFIINAINNKFQTGKKGIKNNIIFHNDNINKLNIITSIIRNNIEDKKNIFFKNFRLLITIIYSTLKLISIINHSRNISISVNGEIFYEKRDDLIKNYQNYFESNFLHNTKFSFETIFKTKTFLKFLIFLINELNFQIKSIISNVYQILYAKKKEKDPNQKKSLVNFVLFNAIKKTWYKVKKSEEIKDIKENIIFNFDTNEYQQLYEEQLKINKNKLEEKKNIFELDEKSLFKKKITVKKKCEEEIINNNNIKNKGRNNNNNKLPLIDYTINNRSADYISTKDFLEQYYQYYNKNINKFDNMNNSINKTIDKNKFNFIINYTNNLVSDRKEYEKKEKERYKKILIKSKKIKENLEKKEIDIYLKKNKRIKKLIKEQYEQNISTDSEKEEKEKKDELALQLVKKELEESKRPKKYLLKKADKGVSKLYERYDDLRLLELNFLKNKGNFLCDSEFFKEYMFKLKKEFKEKSLTAQNINIRIQNRFMQKKINNKNKKNLFDKYNNINNSLNNFETLLKKRSDIDTRNCKREKKNILQKKMYKNFRKSNSESRINNWRKINITTIF